MSLPEIGGILIIMAIMLILAEWIGNSIDEFFNKFNGDKD